MSFRHKWRGSTPSLYLFQYSQHDWRGPDPPLPFFNPGREGFDPLPLFSVQTRQGAFWSNRGGYGPILPVFKANRGGSTYLWPFQYKRRRDKPSPFLFNMNVRRVNLPMPFLDVNGESYPLHYFLAQKGWFEHGHGVIAEHLSLSNKFWKILKKKPKILVSIFQPEMNLLQT